MANYSVGPFTLTIDGEDPDACGRYQKANVSLSISITLEGHHFSHDLGSYTLDSNNSHHSFSWKAKIAVASIDTEASVDLGPQPFTVTLNASVEATVLGETLKKQTYGPASFAFYDQSKLPDPVSNNYFYPVAPVFAQLELDVIQNGIYSVC